MNIGLFKLNDIERETLTFKNIDVTEFVRRLSTLTDSSTNVGFLDKGRKFHGLVTREKFRLKTIRTFRDEEFIVTGEIKQDGKNVIVNVQYRRGTVYVFFPKFMLLMGVIVGFGSMSENNFDLSYLPVLVVGAVGVIWWLETIRGKEFAKVQNILRSNLYSPGE